MRFVDLINKKVSGQNLTSEEIRFWIEGYVNGSIPDYQVSALLMAIVFRSMDRREILDLTMNMAKSGDMMDLSAIDGVTADKHSTGGVGDKTTLVVGPMAAACGAHLAKMSGRGLGFTGGTIDKLESIDGFHVNLDHKAFIRQVNEIGIAVVGQSGNLVPADKKLYALRDVTGTVSSIPLIASSIMSKKLASGSQVIVLDVKYGSGAFMKTVDQARELADTMIRIGRGAGRKVRAVISSMEEPLGHAIGNALEVREACQALMGNGPDDLMQLCLTLGSLILIECGICSDPDEARERLMESVKSGRALDKLVQMVKAQGGRPEQIYDPSLLPCADHVTSILSPVSGFVHSEDALALGNLAMQLGAGRAKKDDAIMKETGIVLCVKPGDYIEAGSPLAAAHHRLPLPDGWLEECVRAFDIREQREGPHPLIADIL